ncbi:hypothetical protein CBS147326_9899 [Penicillium roqueforti]|nr:hypothetical protein CBS147326_9899 [Penicillium roqueforti]
MNTHVFLTGRVFGLTKEHRQLATVTDDIHFLPTQNHQLPATPPATGKRKRVDRWSQRAGPQTPTKSAARPQTESLPITYQSQDPTQIIAPGDDDEEDAQITWPDTPEEIKASSRTTTPVPERRSQRPRKTSYADILAQSKYDT